MSENSSRTHCENHGKHSHHGHHTHKGHHHPHHKKEKTSIFTKMRNKILVDCGAKEISLLLVVVIIMIIVIPVVAKLFN